MKFVSAQTMETLTDTIESLSKTVQWLTEINQQLKEELNALEPQRQQLALKLKLEELNAQLLAKALAKDSE